VTAIASLVVMLQQKREVRIMDSGVIFSVVLSVLFFGAIIWLIIHSRRQAAQINESERPEPHKPTEPKGRD
jgi:Mn2+/Fe2+ NRAMP family transporter